MQEYRQQMEQENQRSFSDVDSLATGDGIQAVGRSSHKLIEAVMQSTPRGKVCSTSFSFFLVVVWDPPPRFFCLLACQLSPVVTPLMNCSVQIQTIKQGYLLKRSSNLRGDWKRRFFVLDSRGMLYYYRKQWGKPTVSLIPWGQLLSSFPFLKANEEVNNIHGHVWGVEFTFFPPLSKIYWKYRFVQFKGHLLRENMEC